MRLLQKQQKLAHTNGDGELTVNMTLPSLTANMERIYPFAKRNGIKKGIVQNINFQYLFCGKTTLLFAPKLNVKENLKVFSSGFTTLPAKSKTSKRHTKW